MNLKNFGNEIFENYYIFKVINNRSNYGKNIF